MGYLARFTFLIGAAALFAGCGAQSGGTLPRGVTVAQGRVHRASASSGDLLYVSNPDGVYYNIEMLTYPQGQPVGTFVPPGEAWNLCSDASGNVWVPSQQAVYEYAHGGTSPIQTLNASFFFMIACSIDATTGNLAAVGGGEYAPEIAIWSGAQGNPTYYILPFTGWSMAYDDAGNLFVDGSSASHSFLLAELPKGGSAFTNITLDQPAKWAGNVNWDGKYIAVGTINTAQRKDRRHVVYRVQISGSIGHVVKTVYLYDKNPVLGSWIGGNTIIAVHTKVHDNFGIVAFWKYPGGGRPFQKITGFSYASGITVSVGPSRSRIHR